MTVATGFGFGFSFGRKYKKKICGMTLKFFFRFGAETYFPETRSNSGREISAKFYAEENATEEKKIILICCSMRRKHNDRWQLLTRMKDVLFWPA